MAKRCPLAFDIGLNDKPAESDSDKIGQEVVDVEGAEGKQVLHRLGGQRDGNREQQHGKRAVPEDIHEKEGTEEKDGGMEEVVDADA